MTKAASAEAIAEMMATWNATLASARAQFPAASEEALYQMAAQAMNKSLGL